VLLPFLKLLEDELIEIIFAATNTASHLIQQSPGMNLQMEFADGAFRNTTLRPDKW
jgi:hypothetical protein